MNVLKTFVRATWLAAVLLPAVSWAQDTDEAPVGEAVERELLGRFALTGGGHGKHGIEAQHHR